MPSLPFLRPVIDWIKRTCYQAAFAEMAVELGQATGEPVEAIDVEFGPPSAQITDATASSSKKKRPAAKSSTAN